MYTGEREKEILNILSQDNYVTVEYLAKKIHISPSSIRRDLKRLELRGLITRSYGGAEIKQSMNKQIPFFMRSHQNTKEKLPLAKTGASFVKPGDVVFLDSSTSTYFMVRYLKQIKGITVITNSLATMAECSEYDITAYLAGGRLNPENRSCFIGMHAESFVKSFHADFCFFSAQALAKTGEIYDCFANEIMIRRLMLENADKSVFLCDGSKIDRYSAYKMCDLSEVDVVISDAEPEKCLDKEFKNVSFCKIR